MTAMINAIKATFEYSFGSLDSQNKKYA